MNKICMLIIVNLIFLLGTNVGASNMEKGFSKYVWGDSVSKYTGLSELGVKGDVSYYSSPEETYTVGDVLIEKITYGFYMDQLFGVYLDIDSIEIYDQLLAHMKSQYGLPDYKTTANNQIVYKWKQQDVTIKLKMHKPTEKMKLAFYFKPVASQLQQNQWEELDTSSFHFVPIEKGKKPEKFVLFEF